MKEALKLSRLWRLSHKEIKETSRDRRTIVTLLLMPLLVYPLMSMALNRFLLSSGETGKAAYQVGVGSDQEGQEILRLLNDDRSQPPQSILDSSSGQLAQFDVLNTVDVNEGPSRTPEEALLERLVDIAVEIERDAPPKIKIYAHVGDGRSENARRVLVERLQWMRMGLAEAAAIDGVRSGAVAYQPPPEIEVIDRGEPEKTSVLATIVPLILVLMTITGAVYPAIDLTAGERERGTMESLMASPVPRFQVLLGKYFAVVVVALLTAVANMTAMFTTLWLGGLLPLLTGDNSFPWLKMLQVFCLLVLFSGFFSAILLSLTSFARSFKEAQAYLIPVMLLSITPGMLSLIPGIELSGVLAIAPLINIVLLAREVIGGTAQLVPATMAIVSTLFYAAAAISVAANLFGSDAVTRTSNGSFVTLLKRPRSWTDVPTLQTASLVLAILVPAYFVLSNLLMQYLSNAKAVMIGGAAELTQAQSVNLQIHSMILSAITLTFVFGGIPAAANWFGRHRFLTSYRITAPGIVSMLGALVMGFGAWAIAHEAFVLADAVGIGGLSEERIAQTKQILQAWTSVPPWLLLLTLAATPAVIEELCFRGFLFSAILRITTPVRTIVLTSFLFAIFHVLTGNALLIERFVPSFLLGIVLGTIAYRSGSVFPGMVMHFVHNGLLEMIGHYHKDLTFLGANFENQTHLPPLWLLIATSIAVVGGAIVWLGTRSIDRTLSPAHPPSPANPPIA